MLYTINFLRLYAIIFLVIYDRHYFFSLCYKKGAGLTTQFVPFYINQECLYWAFFVIFATYLILFFVTELARYVFSLILGKNKIGLIANIAIVVLTTWLFYLLRLFSLVI
ncbi:Uncharacterised protein [Legionella steigerwaltii]|uniref:Uncharacterized protein n=1 Tax=Legionella steigerwaltii TaxID=460 RepID=A0A378L4Q6_9GAMM|nr:hypothetical protein [Legionella steigerwaltii]KTD69901.1 hypothetical protein Lstg_3342 [Legionella steigerwaltii]STY21786.1 Uncharacterised protein [Legionella steigerwaltii]